jgi:hypothetical protein
VIESMAMKSRRGLSNRWSSSSRALATGLRWLLAGVLGYVAYSEINYASLTSGPILLFDVVVALAIAFVLGLVVSTFVVRSWILAPLALIALQVLVGLPGLVSGGDPTLWPIGLLLALSWLLAASIGSALGALVRLIGRQLTETRS